MLIMNTTRFLFGIHPILALKTKQTRNVEPGKKSKINISPSKSSKIGHFHSVVTRKHPRAVCVLRAIRIWWNNKHSLLMDGTESAAAR